MSKRTELLILTAAAVAMAFIAPYAFADNLTQSGAGNVAEQNVGNINGNGNNSPSSNSPHLSATGGTANATGGSAHSDSNAVSVSSQNQGQHQTSTSKVNDAGNSSNSYTAEAQKRAPVSTAFAAPLVAADDTCMGSSSAGGQAVGFGLSVGSTWKDADCVRRKDARELHNMKQYGAALALMCQNADVAAAMQTAGTPCPGTSKAGELTPAAGHSERASVNEATEGVINEYPTSARRSW